MHGMRHVDHALVVHVRAAIHVVVQVALVGRHAIDEADEHAVFELWHQMRLTLNDDADEVTSDSIRRAMAETSKLCRHLFNARV